MRTAGRSRGPIRIVRAVRPTREIVGGWEQGEEGVAGVGGEEQAVVAVTVVAYYVMKERAFSLKATTWLFQEGVLNRVFLGDLSSNIFLLPEATDDEGDQISDNGAVRDHRCPATPTHFPSPPV